ncbi:MarR family transcriptional regulator [Paenibacillus glycanilyticus]|uniref:MarR family winged helix-turn-helix transcriptional regulator n=1 Tax=Paenibacillus glycanilyticus TaxID=126569 RepID=UPI00203E86AA|nr:MarR family transcriptional regulator [Paenibacillus glycanilyticus]MCM3626976.1 MarR family transcriptional regulator [Paenibacillus glycanilyticus]
MAADSMDIYQSFFRITRQLKKLAFHSAANLGVTVHQINILESVRLNPGRKQKELTEQLVFAKSRVSVHIDQLVEKGLIIREPSEQDRREIQLFITTAGEELCLLYNQEAASYKALSGALEQLSSDDVEKLHQLHQQILSHL